jgi:predicted CopG family antitoxin
MRYNMKYMKLARTFTISSDILEEISTTKGARSTSERVNELLKRALDWERREALEQQAAEFFAGENVKAAEERAAFQKASKRALSRD